MIKQVELVVIGASSGGLDVLITLLKALPEHYRIPTVAVLHQRPNRSSGVPEMLAKYTHLQVQEPEDKQGIEAGCFYVAPPNYHLLIDGGKVFSLSLDAPLNFCRPSIDMAMESAAEVYQEYLVGCVLTGANADGAEGVRYIKEKGGYVLVQEPREATVDSMPKAAIAATEVDEILPMVRIAERLSSFAAGGQS
ncbi:MAG: chemotaxis protein CheB [Pseudomonadota bacterium]|nr:chemotaxis protein CheB [Pseudomonadota bacterium]